MMAREQQHHKEKNIIHIISHKVELTHTHTHSLLWEFGLGGMEWKWDDQKILWFFDSVKINWKNLQEFKSKNPATTTKLQTTRELWLSESRFERCGQVSSALLMFIWNNNNNALMWKSQKCLDSLMCALLHVIFYLMFFYAYFYEAEISW